MANNNDLFVSLVSDIKNYTGKDPLLPWIRYNPLSPPFLRLSLFILCYLLMVVWLQRNPEDEGLATPSLSEGEAPSISAEMRTEIRV